MDRTRVAYAAWAPHYDDAPNPTREADRVAMLELAPRFAGRDLLELGCGTGKNSVGFAGVARSVLGVDISEDMLAVARARGLPPHVRFERIEVGASWPVDAASMDVVTASLVLEHIPSLPPVFAEAARVLRPGGWLWTSELHPYRQWQGSRARFRDAAGHLHVPDNYSHSFSDYLRAARASGLELWEVSEPLEEGLPRLLVMGFRKAGRSG